MQKKNEIIKLKVITALVASQVLHETFDDLESTNIPKYLKKSVENLENDLTKYMDEHLKNLHNIDDETMMLLQEGILGISKEVSKLDLEVVAALGDLFKTAAIEFKK